MCVETVNRIGRLGNSRANGEPEPWINLRELQIMYTTPVSGTATTAAGVAVLPNTSGNTLLTVLAISLITVGTLVVVSFVASKLIRNFG